MILIMQYFVGSGFIFSFCEKVIDDSRSVSPMREKLCTECMGSENYYDDIETLSYENLGYRRGFAPINRESVLGDKEVTPRVVSRCARRPIK